MLCTQCSGNDFEKLSERIYRCKYCGTVTQGSELKKNSETGYAGSEGISRNDFSSRQQNNKKLLISVTIIAAIFFLAGFIYFIGARGVPENSHGPEKLQEFGRDVIEKESKPEGNFSKISIIPDTIGNLYFVGIYRNTGKTAIRKPRVTIFLLSKDGARIASGNGYGIRDVLQPAEETPVKILVRDAPQFSSYEVQHEPKHPFLTNQVRPKLEFYDMKLVKGRYSGYEITGKCRNKSTGRVRYIRVAALINDSDKKIIGMGTGSLHAQFLDPGEYTPFRVRITSASGKPGQLYIDYSARLDR